MFTDAELYKLVLEEINNEIKEIETFLERHPRATGKKARFQKIAKLQRVLELISRMKKAIDDAGSH